MNQAIYLYPCPLIRYNAHRVPQLESERAGPLAKHATMRGMSTLISHILVAGCSSGSTVYCIVSLCSGLHHDMNWEES